MQIVTHIHTSPKEEYIDTIPIAALLNPILLVDMRMINIHFT